MSEGKHCWIDESNDALLYTVSRCGQHLEDAFRAHLTRRYRDCPPADGVVLELMSSWVAI